MPWPRSQSIMCATNGLSASGTTGLGTVEVSGRSRVPSPPARIRACMRAASSSGAPPPDALVLEARRPDGDRVEEVAPVDDQATAHPLGDRGPVELAELGPLGDQDGGVGAGQR